ncbi:MAG: hypothetical protein Q9213_002367 [Squamulea squamosa]
MCNENFVGRRLSCDGSLCTIRWQGEIEGLKGQWLGVEWDDPSRGKHNGKHGDKRYFDCCSNEPTAASFIRPDSKRIDKPQRFVSAVKEKYGSETSLQNVKGKSNTILISGKEVDEVGFDAISKKQSAWSELEIVSLDGLRIKGFHKESPYPTKEDLQVLPTDLKWKELDLSRNLFDDWNDVGAICSSLRELRVLKLNGNRFNSLNSGKEEFSDAFKQLTSLSLANTAVGWDDIQTLCTQHDFHSLQSLSLAFNPLHHLPRTSLNFQLPNLATLDLTSCNLTSLKPLTSLSHLPRLTTLILRSNPLTTLTTHSSLNFPHLQTLDITSTRLPTLSSLNPILSTFPSLTSLKTSSTPMITSHPSARLITIARLPGLTTLNNTPIPHHERQNAELYYLSTITPLFLDAKSEHEERVIGEQHPQWGYLCERHGEPESITKKRNPPEPLSQIKSSSDSGDHGKPIYPALSLGANLITFTFQFPLFFPSSFSSSNPSSASSHQLCSPPKDAELTHIREISKHVDVYRLKALVGRLYSIPCMEIKLVLETDEWDPVPAAKPEDDDWSCSDDVWSEDETPRIEEQEQRKREKDKNLWVHREIELVDSTRPVAFWIEGREAKVRVERRDLRLLK